MVINVHIDGASRNNPGNAGAGILIEDGAGVVIAELKEYLGITTNNEAEYKALIIALNYLSKMTASEGTLKITFFSDSQLLVKQMNGEYSVKSPNILPLYLEVKKILKNRRIDCSFTYISREFNKQADRLANLAIDEALARRGSPLVL
ncbi:MAG: ribonuclease HI family protein [Deltaproteobacteria bacterium]|jgi:ribonuclease HI|nr:ribonuclease HI family protein [Deltaproteobacteria bacterium]MCL5879849.1 ribonuclease HI family protein [Deltaproteobacteria bacterium]MDA8303868.1 ribonuclease HI family protein [Deltaproteobacteria bacterium]